MRAAIYARYSTDLQSAASIEDLLGYFRSAEKPVERWRIGTEHEKIGIYEDTLERIPYEGERGVGALLDRIANASIREVVIATNPTFDGEATASMLARLLTEREIQVTRIARGIPSGGEIVHMNSAVLGDALRGRASFE